MVDFCLALRDREFQRAEQIRRQNASLVRDENFGFDNCLLTCSLLFGAEYNVDLVKYIVEKENVDKNDILTSTKWMKKRFTEDIERNALSFAIDKGNEDVVEYLHEGWSNPCVSNNLLLALSQLTPVQQTIWELPEGFASMPFNLQSVWYFCKRYIGTDFHGEGKDWLDTARERLESDEDFLMSRVRLQDEGSLFNLLWELYGHDRPLFLAMMNDKEAVSLPYFLPLRHSTSTPKKIPLLKSLLTKRSFRLRMLAEALLMIQYNWDQFEDHWIRAGSFEYLHSAEYEATLCDHPFLHELKFLALRQSRIVWDAKSNKSLSFHFLVPLVLACPSLLS
ncbi:hypothetical protein MMC22_010005 [Lobaria immixta]|nr:hypothetical protein [Lobaria immixta]